jgi:hypothetical protein
MQFMMNTLEKKEEIQAPVEVSHKVLFIYSYNPLYFTYDSQIKGLKKSLYPKGIEYDILFLDSNERGLSNYKMLAEYVQARIVDKKYEAILIGDDSARRFAVEYQDRLFPKIAMVFFRIGDY